MNTEILKNELQYRTARSGGKGGQNVNKVETKVEILFDVAASAVFSEAEKLLIFSNLANKINKEGVLQVTHQTERSQLGNKQWAEKKLFNLIERALIVEKERKPTKTPPSVIAHRKADKRRTGEKKTTRRKVKSDDTGFDLFFMPIFKKNIAKSAWILRGVFLILKFEFEKRFYLYAHKYTYFKQLFAVPRSNLLS